MQTKHANDGRGAPSATNVIFAGILVFLVILISPAIAAASVLGLIGFACARSALVDRQTGWVFGFILGVFLMAVVLGGMGFGVYSMFLR